MATTVMNTGKLISSGMVEVVQGGTPMKRCCVVLLSVLWLSIATAAAQTASVHIPTTATKTTELTWRCRQRVGDCRYKRFRTSSPAMRPPLILGVAH